MDFNNWFFVMGIVNVFFNGILYMWFNNRKLEDIIYEWFDKVYVNNLWMIIYLDLMILNYLIFNFDYSFILFMIELDKRKRK